MRFLFVIAVLMLIVMMVVSSFQIPKPITKSLFLFSGGGSSTIEGEKDKDFSGEAAGVLGSYRVPAMLLVGGAYGGVFALPLLAEADSFLVSMSKRTYMIIALATVASELLSVIVSTMAMDRLSLQAKAKVTPAPTVKEFLKRNCHLEFLTVKVHFLLGLIGFVIMYEGMV